MRLKRFGDRFQVRLDSGESVREPLTRLLGAEGIGFAAISAIGAVGSANVWFWNAATREYETHDVTEQMEVVSLLGTATIKEGVPFVHMHVALGRRDLSIIGGHFGDAVVHPTLEIRVNREAEAIQRELDESCGLFVMQLPERA